MTDEVRNIQHVLEIIIDESEDMSNKEKGIYLYDEIIDLLNEIESNHND